jgi:peptidyl-tRNA hydrolase, PTH1 family
MKLIIGLGNPGKDYDGTRHNVGFDVIDALAERLGWVPRGAFNRMARNGFDGFWLDGLVQLNSTSGTEKLVLLKPTTYMNDSGRSVLAAMSFYKLTPGEIAIVVDELALEPGQIRLRPDGSDGGHNGLKSIQQALGTKTYPRLRIGIGQPPSYMQGRDYVLGKYSPDQKPLIDQAIARAAGCLLTWADDGMTKAMNLFNVKGPGDGSPEKKPK